MTTFTVKKITKPAAELNGESSLPPLENIPLRQKKYLATYDDTRGLFLGQGFVDSPFPHRLHNRFTRELKDREFDAVILENEYLKAEFLPALGGKLWRLYDKKERRELLFANPVVRYCNLATRNAWTSGGVEFNIGEFGHHAYTCDPLFTARTELADGTPVLRMYEFSRIRCVVYQMDFWLPEGSRVLYARMRIVNPNSDTRPMYWWSNAAVPDWEKGRVLVPAEEAFMQNKAQGTHVAPIPYHHDKDMSYNRNNFCCDTFYILSENRRRFICYTDKDGYTYAHTSTNRLKSRKLFVWGNGEGGKRWQEFLSGEGNPGSYIELQAGLANTQSEHIPMPPLTAWEWIETYGAIRLDPDIAHGEYKTASREAERQLDRTVTADALEALLADTKPMALSPAKELLFAGSSWGALENARRSACQEPLLCEHLDFGGTGTEQDQWLALLHSGSLGEHDTQAVPPSWMRQEEWVEMLEQAVQKEDSENWYSWMQLGCAYMAHRKFRFAKEALERSMALKENCWALYALGCLEKTNGDLVQGAKLVLKAAKMNLGDGSLAAMAARFLHEAGLYRENLDFIETLDYAIAANSRIRVYYAYAYLRTGQVDKAEEILNAKGGIDMADIKEGEVIITDLWFDIQEAKAAREGKAFDRTQAKPPKKFDFRMHA